MSFVVNMTTTGKASWWLYAEDGHRIAWAGEMFPTVQEARQAVIAFRRGSASARFEVYEDEASRWRWRAWQRWVLLAASGESFASKSLAEQAALSVRLHVVLPARV